MHELRRMAYLAALGIDSYVSRAQLPGAAVSRRLAIVTAPAAAATSSGAPEPRVTAAAVKRREAPSRPQARGESAKQTPATARGSLPHGEPVPRFSLTTIVAGHWLWLEELAGMPLATEQVQLVQAMAQALLLSLHPRSETDTAVARPDVAQFDWPIHNNHQLDLGAEAARASVAGFVARRLEQHACRGLVLLGQSGALRLAVQELGIVVVSTASSAEILAQSALKRQVWRDLQPLVNTS